MSGVGWFDFGSCAGLRALMRGRIPGGCVVRAVSSSVGSLLVLAFVIEVVDCAVVIMVMFLGGDFLIGICAWLRAWLLASVCLGVAVFP